MRRIALLLIALFGIILCRAQANLPNMVCQDKMMERFLSYVKIEELSKL